MGGLCCSFELLLLLLLLLFPFWLLLLVLLALLALVPLLAATVELPLPFAEAADVAPELLPPPLAVPFVLLP